MSATYLGQVTVGGTAGGLSAAYATLFDAMSALRSAAAAAAAALAAGASSASASVTLIGAAEVSISAQALPSPSAQVSGSLEAVAQLTAALLDPVGYFQGLLAGVDSALAAVTADLALPGPAILAQIQSAASISVELDLGLSALTASIGELSGIGLSVAASATALLAAKAAVDAALAAASGAISAAASVLALVATPGAYALVYDGPLSGLGAALDAATPSSGVSASTPVRTVVSFVLQADAPAMSAQAALLKVS